MLKSFLLSFASNVDFNNPIVSETVSILPESLLPDPFFLIIIGLILIGVTIFILFFLKKFIMNSVLGLILWAIVTFIFNIELPFIPSLVVSVVIGPAGVGTMLLLNAFGILVV